MTVVSARLSAAPVPPQSGANRAIRAALTAKGVTSAVSVGHDLDPDNLDLLRTGEVVARHNIPARMRRDGDA